MQIFRYLVLAFLLQVGVLLATAQRQTWFSPEQRAVANKSQIVVMNFLERYFDDLSLQKNTTIERKMSDDKVYFRKGNLSDLQNISDTIPFSINLFDNYYEVDWMKADEPFVTIVFPAQYDLLLGMPQNEAQQLFKTTVLEAPERTKPVKEPVNLIQVEKALWKSKADTLELASLNDALYYNKVREGFKPVFSADYPDFSAANLFHGLINNVDYLMYVEQSLYGLKTINYTISLRQWLNYCAEWDMKVYFAVEEIREDGLLALIIAQSRELGFNHLLSVVIPNKFIADRRSVMKVRLTPYIPIHNVKNLFQRESVNRRKIIWQ